MHHFSLITIYQFHIFSYFDLSTLCLISGPRAVPSGLPLLTPQHKISVESVASQRL
jgi:hypothetical protein